MSAHTHPLENCQRARVIAEDLIARASEFPSDYLAESVGEVEVMIAQAHATGYSGRIFDEMLARAEAAVAAIRLFMAREVNDAAALRLARIRVEIAKTGAGMDAKLLCEARDIIARHEAAVDFLRS